MREKWWSKSASESCNLDCCSNFQANNLLPLKCNLPISQLKTHKMVSVRKLEDSLVHLCVPSCFCWLLACLLACSFPCFPCFASTSIFSSNLKTENAAGKSQPSPPQTHISAFGHPGGCQPSAKRKTMWLFSSTAGKLPSFKATFPSKSHLRAKSLADPVPRC